MSYPDYIKTAVFNFEDCFGPHAAAIDPNRCLILISSSECLRPKMNKAFGWVSLPVSDGWDYESKFTSSCDVCGNNFSVCNTINDYIHICYDCYQVISFIQGKYDISIVHLGNLMSPGIGYSHFFGKQDFGCGQSELREYKLQSILGIIIDDIHRRYSQRDTIAVVTLGYSELFCSWSLHQEYINRRQLHNIADEYLCDGCYHNIRLCMHVLLHKLFLYRFIADEYLNTSHNIRLSLPKDVAMHIYELEIAMMIYDHELDFIYHIST